MEHVTKDCQCEGKVCTRCKGTKCIGMFSIRKAGYQRKQSIHSYCKTCSANRSKEWHDANPERVSQGNKTWRENNAEYNKLRTRKWVKDNPDKVSTARAKRRLERNGGVRKRRGKLTPEQRKEAEHDYNVRYYSDHKGENTQRVLEFFDTHPGYRASVEAKRRTRKSEAGGSYTLGEWKELKAHYNYACLCCGRKEPEIQLHADHVLPVIKGGSSYIENIQPLCKSCNSSKGRKFIDFRPNFS